jgi:hypothetical protein
MKRSEEMSMLKPIAALAVIAAFALTACDQPTPGPTDEVAPAGEAVQSGFGPQLADCAGVTAAYANIDVLAYPQQDGELENFFGSLLALMDKEPGFEGASGRNAANAAKAEWAALPRTEQEARITGCREQFGPQGAAPAEAPPAPAPAQ